MQIFIWMKNATVQLISSESIINALKTCLILSMELLQNNDRIKLVTNMSVVWLQATNLCSSCKRSFLASARNNLRCLLSGPIVNLSVLNNNDSVDRNTYTTNTYRTLKSVNCSKIACVLIDHINACFEIACVLENSINLTQNHEQRQNENKHLAWMSSFDAVRWFVVCGGNYILKPMTIITCSACQCVCISVLMGDILNTICFYFIWISTVNPINAKSLRLLQFTLSIHPLVLYMW